MIEAEAAPDAEHFDSQEALARLDANRPSARLVEIWNAVPGITPVHKFKDRKTAVSRIWKALHPEACSAEYSGDDTATPVAPQTPDVAPPEQAAKRKATRTERRPTAQAKEKPVGNKTQTVLALIEQPDSPKSRT